jgi:hypothetical protein
MDLREYEQVKFDLAALLRSADACDRRDPQGRHAQDDLVRDLFSRLAEDRFNLVVVGRFSRGKTSLMNAVLATERLPTGIRPLTSVITTVAYGSQEKAVIHYENSRLPEDIPLSALPQYITEQGNSANRRGVRIAEVQLPAELLRRGFYFVDTPGLGSPIIENTRTTERFLPQADAFVLVTSYEGPLSEEELRFLNGAARSGRRIFVVVNKQDMVSVEERAEALSYLEEQLSGLAGVKDEAIFSASARDGLAAKRTRDTRMLADSGIAAFEDALVRFLINDKSREFLLGMCQRIGGFLRELPHRPEVVRFAEQLATLATRIDASRATARESLPPGMASAVPRDAALATGQIRPCEICAEVTRQSYDFLRVYQYDIIVSPERQRELAERGGLCSFHIWGYESVASPHGICAGFAAVLDRLAARLSRAVEARSLASGPGGLVPEPSCIVCEARAAAEAAAVQAIVIRLRQNPDEVLRSLTDFCIPHFRLLMAEVSDPGIAARLFAREAALLQHVAEDMRRYALKHEGVRRYLASEEETKAAQRALSLLGGHRTLNTPPPGRVSAHFRLPQSADTAD